MADDYVTKTDLAEALANVTETILGRVDGMMSEFQKSIYSMMMEFQRNIIEHIDENFVTKQEFKSELAATEDRLTEKIHDTETRLLRGFEFHARATETHLKTLDVQSAANFLAQAGLGSRISDLETQVREIKNPPPPQ